MTVEKQHTLKQAASVTSASILKKLVSSPASGTVDTGVSFVRTDLTIPSPYCGVQLDHGPTRAHTLMEKTGASVTTTIQASDGRLWPSLKKIDNCYVWKCLAAEPWLEAMAH